MKKFNVCFICLCVVSAAASQKSPTPPQVFQEFWEWVDNNYIYFEAKNIDWTAVYQAHAPLVTDSTSQEDLFEIMETCVLELKDAHSALFRPGKVSQLYDYRKGYDIFFDRKIISDNYIVDSLGNKNDVFWGILEDNIGYIYWPSFFINAEFMEALREFNRLNVSRLIIDVRNNSGGDSNLVPKLLSQMVAQKTLLGAYIEKNGPGHKDVTPPVGIYAEPDEPQTWSIPIVVLTNRISYSATSYFVAMVKGLPNMKVVGQKTGGGAGGHLGYQLSNGWLIRVSVSDFVGKDLKSIEIGVEPDVFIENSKEDIEKGRDVMLETAREVSF